MALKHSLALSLLVSLQSGGEAGRQRETVIDTNIKQNCLGKNIMCELCIKRLRVVIAHVFMPDGGGMCSRLNAERQHDG